MPDPPADEPKMSTEQVPVPTAADYMTSSLQTVSPSMPLRELVRFLLLHKVSSAPVVDEHDRLLGFISERDCLAAIANESFSDSGVVQDASQIMRRHPTSIAPDTALFRVTSMFIEHGYRHLPVVHGEILVGVVSRSDVLRAVNDFWAEPSD